MNNEYLGISTKYKWDKWETNLVSFLAEKAVLTETKKEIKYWRNEKVEMMNDKEN